MRCLSLLLLPLLASGCGVNSACADRLIETRAAPDGSLAAFRFVRDCGATTGYATHIAIGPVNGGIAGATSVFVADSRDGAAIGADNAIEASLEWDAPQRLIIHHSAKARVFRSDKAARGVSIAYLPTL